MLSRLSWSHSTNDIRTPFYRFLGVGCGLLSGKALEDYASIGADLEVPNRIIVAVSSRRRSKGTGIAHCLS